MKRTKWVIGLLTILSLGLTVKAQLEFRACTDIAAFEFPEYANLPGKNDFTYVKA
jgi:hypothetical protein